MHHTDYFKTDEDIRLLCVSLMPYITFKILNSATGSRAFDVPFHMAFNCCTEGRLF